MVTWHQVWAWLQTPHAIWWIYGGGIAFLLLIGIVKTLVVKKKRQARQAAMGRVPGAVSQMRRKPTS